MWCPRGGHGNGVTYTECSRWCLRRCAFVFASFCSCDIINTKQTDAYVSSTKLFPIHSLTLTLTTQGNVLSACDFRFVSCVFFVGSASPVFFFRFVSCVFFSLASRVFFFRFVSCVFFWFARSFSASLVTLGFARLRRRVPATTSLSCRI